MDKLKTMLHFRSDTVTTRDAQLMLQAYVSIEEATLLARWLTEPSTEQLIVQNYERSSYEVNKTL